GEKYLKVGPGGGVNYLKRGDVGSNTQGTLDLEDLISKFITGGAGKATSSSTATECSASQPADEAVPSFVELFRLGVLIEYFIETKSNG
ncbi:hypothetical protein ACG9XS_22550, partial [Acinetobacter gyllenbergii]